MDDDWNTNTIKVLAPMTKIASEFAQAMQPVAKAFQDFGLSAQQSFSGMWGMANVGMEPSDGSYPPDMDMD